MTDREKYKKWYKIIYPRYTYKDKLYYIESTCELKNPQTRNWEKAVVYISLENSNRYVRSEEEFNERFKLVEDE